MTISYCLDYLLAHQNADGGWGYRPASPSAAESTAWALGGLEGAPASPSTLAARDRARAWLLAAQLPNGAWPPFPGHPEGCWVTSIASEALHREGGADAAVERGLAWLVNSWPAEGGWWWRCLEALRPAREAGQDSSLRGWSWTPGTASWVVPTAHALLFLRALTPDRLSSAARRRQTLAERMLYNRMCPGGGWNSGNPRIYGVAGVPRIGPTAWALLALRDDAGREEIQRSRRWLVEARPGIRGAASLALAHWSLASCGEPLPSLTRALGEMFSSHQFLDNTLTVAWIMRALAAEARTRSGEAAP